MKTALITGCSKGIGYETALAFALAGYQVFATMRNPAASTLPQKVQEGNLPIVIRAMDVDSDTSVSKVLGDILKENGQLDVLVNNAGIERHGSVEEMKLSDFQAIMETNYFGALRCIKAVLPSMRENRNGCIVNIASVAGHISSSPLGGYSASKFALEAVSEALAQEVKSFNIRVAIVEPGIINTQMARDIREPGASIYPHSRRFGGLFAASLKTPASPDLVAQQILTIAESDSWKLRYPVGPDAEPFLAWRAAMSDEEWIAWNAADDKTWYAAVERDFGLNARSEQTRQKLNTIEPSETI